MGWVGVGGVVANHIAESKHLLTFHSAHAAHMEMFLNFPRSPDDTVYQF